MHQDHKAYSINKILCDNYVTLGFYFLIGSDNIINLYTYRHNITNVKRKYQLINK